MGEYAWLPALLAFLIAAIGWLFRELHFRRERKREAAHDAGKTLSNKKALLEDMIFKADDDSSRQMLTAQLDEVNAALLGLYAKRLRQTLKDAGLPTEEMLIANGRSWLQPQEATRLEASIEELKSLPPSHSTQDLLVLGNAYYHMEQYEEARRVYDKILTLNPNEPATLNNRGVTYRHLGRYEEALADHNRSLELRPDDSDTLNNRGVTYGDLQRYEEALADHNRSLELRPDDPDTLDNRGLAYRHLGRYEEALADHNRSLELRPDNPTTLNNRGVTYRYLGRYEEALTDFNRVLTLKPSDPAAFYNLACLFSLCGKADDALSYLEKAISKDKKYREDPKTDKDFDNIRDDLRFKKLIESD